MSGDTIEITTAFLQGRLKGLQDLETRVNIAKNGWIGKVPPALKAGQDVFPPAKALKLAYLDYAKSVVEGMETVRLTVHDIAQDLLKAGRTLHQGNEEALSEAQMLEVLHDVLSGVAPKTTLP
ncbi:hypothetical protein AB0E96_39215 [Kitasatospora sp. NPDC036755]|uniref:hypothetical protein n=1 Tax=Kitasatospora sp. NPDC036755 TaxID=3154600 RepID=UPI0033BFFA52